jgi:hypothetical protein
MLLLYNLGQHFCQVGDSQCLVCGISQDLSPNHLRFWFRNLLLKHCHHSLLELRSLDKELDKLLSSSELRLLDEELDKDDEDKDSFENLEVVSAIDPSAIVNSFLGTDFERSGP